MSKLEKALAKLKQNPRNVRYTELENILIGLGFEKIPGKGSHAKFVFGQHILVVPYQKPFLKPEYIKLAIQTIDEVDIDVDI